MVEIYDIIQACQTRGPWLIFSWPVDSNIKEQSIKKIIQFSFRVTTK